MKKIENSFAVTGFIGKDAEIRQFTSASVAKFLLGSRSNRDRWQRNQKSISFHGCGGLAQERKRIL